MNENIIEKRMNQGREYRKMEMRAVGDPADMVVEGYAAVYDEPYLLWSEPGYKLYEIIDRNALNGADQSDVIMRYDHEGRVFARNSNDTLQLSSDDHGYKMRGLLGGTDLGRQIYQEIQGGYTTRMSWAFKVKRDSKEVNRDEAANEIIVTRRILEVEKVYDVAPVALPANDATEISARNYSEGVIGEVKQELLEAENKRKAREDAIKRIKLLAEV